MAVGEVCSSAGFDSLLLNGLHDVLVCIIESCIESIAIDNTMASHHQVRPQSFLSPQYINGVYIPSGLLLIGCAIVKIEWIPYAVVLALALGSWKVYSNRECQCTFRHFALGS